jgi:hypothetical protein
VVPLLRRKMLFERIFTLPFECEMSLHGRVQKTVGKMSSRCIKKYLPHGSEEGLDWMFNLFNWNEPAKPIR